MVFLQKNWSKHNEDIHCLYMLGFLAFDVTSWTGRGRTSHVNGTKSASVEMMKYDSQNSSLSQVLYVYVSFLRTGGMPYFSRTGAIAMSHFSRQEICLCLTL